MTPAARRRWWVFDRPWTSDPLAWLALVAAVGSGARAAAAGEGDAGAARLLNAPTAAVTAAVGTGTVAGGVRELRRGRAEGRSRPPSRR